MAEEVKKISFVFSKLAKKTAIVSSKLNQPKTDNDKVEFIDCLEGKSIKLKDPIKCEDRELVIPLKRENKDDNVKNEVSSISSVDIVIKNEPTEVSLENHQDETKFVVNDSILVKKETLDEIAAREILEDLNKKQVAEENQVFSVPLTNNAPIGEAESSLDDYDNIPVTQFGLAMLRGMGWAPGKGIGKNEKLVTPSLPTLRPKGMGLGADKVLKSEIESSKSIDKDLKMAKGSFVRIIAGTHKDSYGQIEGFDDESGRMIVKITLKNITVSLNEFMTQLVEKNEYLKNSKVINMGKYEQYKDDECKKESSEGLRKEGTGNYKEMSSRSSEQSEILHKTRPKPKTSEELHCKNYDSSIASNSKRDYKSGIARKEIKSSSKSRRTYSSSSNKTSDSDSDYSDRKKHRTKKKKPSSHRHKSRTRSRSPKHHRSHNKHNKRK